MTIPRSISGKEDGTGSVTVTDEHPPRKGEHPHEL